jgi:hypothetical protein
MHLTCLANPWDALAAIRGWTDAQNHAAACVGARRVSPASGRSGSRPRALRSLRGPVQPLAQRKAAAVLAEHAALVEECDQLRRIAEVTLGEALRALE